MWGLGGGVGGEEFVAWGAWGALETINFYGFSSRAT